MTMAKKKGLKASNKSSRSNKSHLSVDVGMSIRDTRVRIVIDFMQANLQRKISSPDFAGEAKLSVSHLSRLFKTQTGLAPGEYLIRLRMERARHLLTTSLLSIKEIMAMAGYNNKGLFVDHFKRYSGHAPSEYRKGLSSS